MRRAFTQQFRQNLKLLASRTVTLLVLPLPQKVSQHPLAQSCLPSLERREAPRGLVGTPAPSTAAERGWAGRGRGQCLPVNVTSGNGFDFIVGEGLEGRFYEKQKVCFSLFCVWKNTLEKFLNELFQHLQFTGSN